MRREGPSLSVSVRFRLAQCLNRTRRRRRIADRTRARPVRANLRQWNEPREDGRRINLSSRQAVVFRWGRLKAEYSLASGFTGLLRLGDPAEYASPLEAGSRAGSTVQNPKIILQVLCLWNHQRARILIYARFDLSEYFKHDAENNLRLRDRN